MIIIAALIAQFVNVDSELGASFGWAANGFSWVFGCVVVGAWMALLAAEGVWDTWALVNRTAEVRRILLASFMVFAGVGIFGFLANTEFARPYLLIAAPLGVTGLIVNHWLWRRRFAAFRRTAGRQYGVVLLGDLTTADTVSSDLRDQLDSHFEVNGVWHLLRPDSAPGHAVRDSDQHPTPVVGASAPGAVAVTAAPVTGPGQPPLPTLSARQLRAKRSLDLAVAGIGTLLLSPLLVVVAAMVILADGGPVLHQQECVGRGGKVFKRWTFRCTPYGAKARPAVGGGQSGHAQRAEYDVATTSIGHLLRRTGLACAPGMFNVLAGQMSVVGPDAVSPGDLTAHPVIVRPGLTGPWRLTDPSDGSADVRYIQNWSVGGDLKIIGRSMKLAVTGNLPC